MECVLIRHPPPQVDAGICYGQTDIPLKDSPHPYAQRLLEYFPKISSWQILSSDLRRCYDLAACIGAAQVTPLLREVNFGEWEHLPWCELPREQTDFWTDDVVNRRPPGGESFTDIIERAEQVIAMLRKQNRFSLLVTHMGFIRSFLVATALYNTTSVFDVSLGFGQWLHLRFQNDIWHEVPENYQPKLGGKCGLV